MKVDFQEGCVDGSKIEGKILEVERFILLF